MPFTAGHFREWASGLILDSGDPWVLEPFQEGFFADVFAGPRAAWLVVPEGNGKTTMLAGLALYHCQFTPQAWVPVAASSRDQAQIMYRQAEGFVLRSPAIRDVFRCQEGMRRIKCESRSSRIQTLAADERTGDGVIPTLALVDELHRHRDLGLYRTWMGKLGKRDGQIVVISTAGEPGSEFEVTRERMRQEGEIERRGPFVRAVGRTSVLHDWAVPEGADVEDMEVVAAANPLSGITAETCAEKFALPGMTLQHWRRVVCNLPTRGVAAAVTEAEWFGALDPDGIPAGEPVWAGLDVAWKWDTTALVPLWWRDGEHRVLGRASVLEPPRDGSSLDPHRVERALIEANALNPLHTVVMDTSRAEQLASWISEELGAVVIDRPQSNAFAVDDYERFMEALREGWLHHSGCPELTQHVMNAIARVLPGGDARFDRPAEGRLGSDQRRRVIDALSAASMAHSAAATYGAGVGPWVLA